MDYHEELKKDTNNSASCPTRFLPSPSRGQHQPCRRRRVGPIVHSSPCQEFCRTGWDSLHYLSLPQYMRKAIPLHFCHWGEQVGRCPIPPRPHSTTSTLTFEDLAVPTAPSYYARYDESVPLSKLSIWHRMAIENRSLLPTALGTCCCLTFRITTTVLGAMLLNCYSARFTRQ